MTKTLGTVIAVAPLGGRRTKADHPALPMTAGELAETAAQCADEGATMIHIHVRKGDGTPLLDAGAYRNVTTAIRSAVGDKLIVQITSEALGVYTPVEQAAVVKATRPEAASLALRELVPDEKAEAGFAALLSWMKQEKVLPQIILYEPAEAVRLNGLQRRGLVPWDDIPVLFVLGRYTAHQQSQPADLLPFLALGVPRFTNWSVCAFGQQEAACVTTAALLGGNIRVGFENNFFLPDGRIAASNAALVQTVAGVIKRIGMDLADADGTREMFRPR